jgi:hypothetical protein
MTEGYVAVQKEQSKTVKKKSRSLLTARLRSQSEEEEDNPKMGG